MYRILCATSALLIVLSAQSALAQQTDTGAAKARDEIIVHGRAINPPKLPHLDAVTVISRDEIDRQQPVNLVDLLRERAGVDVRSSGGPGKATTLRLRGSTQEQVRVLIDGVPVGSTTLGAFNWGDLSSQDIERVEIHRGPQTTLYGASAVGGVVQVFTRRGEQGFGGSVSGGFGNLGSRQAAIRLRGGTESGIRATFSAQNSTTNAVSVFDGGPGSDPETDPFRNTSVGTTVNIPVGKGDLGLFFRHSSSQTELDNFGSDNSDFEQDSVRNHFGADFRAPVTENWTTRLLISQNVDDIEGRDPIFGFNNFDIESMRRQVSWTNEVTHGDYSLIGGVDLEKDRARNVDVDVQEGTRRIGAFALVRYEQERFGLEAGVRHEWNDRSDDEWTYQLAAHYRLTDSLQVLGTFGTSFRPPTLNELFFTDAFTIGNGDLVPERSRGGDLGFRFEDEIVDGIHLTADVRAFHQSYEELIAFINVAPLPPPDMRFFVFQANNLGQVRTSGAEASFRIDCDNLWLDANYTFLRARTTDGFQLRRRPRHSGRLSVGGQWDRFTAEAVLHAMGRTFDGLGETRPVKGYITADVHLGAEVREDVDVRLSVRNVTNHGYQEVRGRNTLPRTYTLSMEIGF